MDLSLRITQKMANQTSRASKCTIEPTEHHQKVKKLNMDLIKPLDLLTHLEEI